MAYPQPRFKLTSIVAGVYCSRILGTSLYSVRCSNELEETLPRRNTGE